MLQAVAEGGRGVCTKGHGSTSARGEVACAALAAPLPGTPAAEGQPATGATVTDPRLELTGTAVTPHGPVGRALLRAAPAAWVRPCRSASSQGTALGSSCILVFSLLFRFYSLKRFYLFMRDTERGRDPGRGRRRLHAGSPMRDSIPGSWGHDLSRSQSNPDVP